MNSQQQTIKESVTVQGIGLHSGETATITFHPAAENFGMRFKRIDIDGQPEIKADVSRVLTTTRGTTLALNEASVSTVEHALAALCGLRIDNVLMEIDGPEVPILDGSAAPFIEALRKAGIEKQDAEREVFKVTETISYSDPVSGTELSIYPSDKLEITVMIDFQSPVLGQQYATMDDLDDFSEEFAACRTFVFVRELEYLLEQNLIKGGDLNNSIVIADQVMEQEELDRLAQKLGKPSVRVDQEGIVNNLELYYRNEPARHKLLDVIGDLALIGVPVIGKIVARKPGHTANVAFAKVLKDKYRQQRKLKGKPDYDPDKEPVFDLETVKEYIPHRHPFLLVDKIIELGDNHIVGVKNVTFTENCFQGHFPNHSVFPGVLQVEALAQTGGVFVLSQKEDKGMWDTYFIKINNFKFKHLVKPGDTLLMRMELVSPVRRGICHMYGKAFVGNKLVSEGELIAQIVKRQ